MVLDTVETVHLHVCNKLVFHLCLYSFVVLVYHYKYLIVNDLGTDALSTNLQEEQQRSGPGQGRRFSTQVLFRCTPDDNHQ